MTNQQFDSLVTLIVELIGRAGAYEGTVSAPRNSVRMGFKELSEARALLVTESTPTNNQR